MTHPLLVFLVSIWETIPKLGAIDKEAHIPKHGSDSLVDVKKSMNSNSGSLAFWFHIFILKSGAKQFKEQPG
jgi:hypothetical protein